VNALRLGIDAAAAGALAVSPDGTVSRLHRFEDGFPGFDGHFPGAPILPAVVQIQVVAAMASEHARVPLALAGVESAKFLSPVRPGEALLASFKVTGSGEKTLHDATLSVDGRPTAAFLLRLVPAGEAP
jgi:3-hydroxyacyl-[acyl-carrier-protein] dehydratase